MAKTDSKACNFRLKNEIVWALEELAERWGCSQTAAVTRAIEAAHAGDGELGRVSKNREEARGPGFNPAEIPGVRVGMKGLVEKGSQVVGLKRYRCGHCGQERSVSWAGGACEGCLGRGHEQKDVRECSGCWGPA